jgi:hypothetical protein
MNLSKVKTGVSSAIFESSVSPLLGGMICACASDWMAYGRRYAMRIEIKISDVKNSGKKVSVKETFDSLESARAFIDKCLFVKTRQELRVWIMRGMPK